MLGDLTKNVAIAQGVTIERAKGGSGDDRITGNNAANQLTGNDGNDILSGRNGADRLVGGDGNDTHQGGAGADTMIGGLGNDTYYVDHVGDTVTDSMPTFAVLAKSAITLPTFHNAGTDTVYASISSYTLPTWVENLYASRAISFAGTGNSLANEIRGHNAADTLNGLAGQDTLVGRGGRDVLTGGDHADLFKYNAKTDTGTTASTRDRITDFQTDLDHIDLSAIDARSGIFNVGPTKGAIFANDAFSFIGNQDFSGVAGQLHYVHVKSFPF